MGKNTINQILIVDDEPNNLRVLYNLLTNEGYQVRAARDGQTALSAVENSLPDLILLDIKMPGMTGYEVCQQLKRNPVTRDVPVIFISALSQVEDIVTAFEMGGVDYITKPFKFEEVMARVSNHITIVQQREQLVMQREQIEAMRERDRQFFDNINQTREQFVRAATHDLKNPLSLVTGYSEMLLRTDEVRASERLKTYAENIHLSGKQMLGLIQGMLEYIQMQATMSPQLQPLQLEKFIEDTLEMHLVNARTKQIAIHYVAPQESIVIHANQQLLQRVMDNLVSNAIKYSPEETAVHVDLISDEKEVCICIEDQGYGIPEKDLPHLFDAFFRAGHTAQKAEGSGLGLSIVKEIVRQHRGGIDVESEVDKGSKFTVRLPLAG